MKMKRVLVEKISRLLTEGGINMLDDKPSKKKLMRYVVFFVGCVIGLNSTIMYSLNSLWRNEEFFMLVVPAGNFGAICTYFTSVVGLYYKRHEVKKMLEIMDDYLFVYPDEEEIKPKYFWLIDEKNGVKVFWLVFVGEFVGFFVAVISPFVGYLIKKKFDGLIYPGWFPWSPEGTWGVTFTFLAESWVALCALWGYYLSMMYAIFITSEFARQFKRLSVAIKTLEVRTLKMVLKNKEYAEKDMRGEVTLENVERLNYAHTKAHPEFKRAYNHILMENITRCIKHHQAIVSTFEYFRPWFSIVFSMELFACMISFALILFCLGVTSSSQLLVMFIGVIIITNANLFTRCYVGELFFEMNELITDSVFYEVNWFNQTKENKRMLSILQLSSKKPLELSGFGIFRACNYTFGGITRTSYSYLNLIRASVKT